MLLLWRIILTIMASGALLLPQASNAQTSERCFAETGFCISGAIRAYWERNGGLPVFGYPITAQAEATVEGRTLQVQWFERDRLEIQSDGSVTAGRLGVERLEQLGAPWTPGPNAPAGAGCRAFAETGYQVCGAFVTYWQRNGGLERFGFPVSEPRTETIEGRQLTVQWFERRRFELHEGDLVLLGLLGREVRENTPPPAPPALPPPSFNNCQADPNAAAAPNYPVRIVGVDKRFETVTLQNVSPEAIDLTGWRMCSIRGNQEHPISGVLAPGETRTFPGPEGAIWSNSDNDPGALYTPSGQLASYWYD
jgi:hypothetical protein